MKDAMIDNQTKSTWKNCLKKPGGIFLASFCLSIGGIYSGSEVFAQNAALTAPVSGDTKTIQTAENEGPSLTLEESLQLALKNHEEIQIAVFSEKERELLPWRVFSAILPSVTGSAGVTYPKEQIKFAESVIVADPLKEASITVRQPLFDGETLPAYKSATDLSEASSESKYFEIRRVLFNVAQAYFSLLQNQKLVDVADESQRLAQEQLRILSERYEAGQAPKNDFLRAQVEASRAERTLTESRNNRELAGNTLASFTGLPAADIKEAGEHRNDLGSLKKQIDAKKWEVKQKWAAFLPDADLVFEQSWLEPESFSRQNNFWTAGVRFTVPFFDGGERMLDLSEQKYELEQLRLRLERLQKDIALQVEEAWRAARTSKVNLTAVLKEKELSQENYDVILSRYESGQASSLDVIDAFAELTNAKTSAVTEQYAYQLSLLDLLKQAGLFGQSYVESLKK
jgi:outer membrane protein TolC